MSGCSQITWEQFFNLVLNQAQIIDSQNQQTPRQQQCSNNATWSVNNTNTQQHSNNNGNRNNPRNNQGNRYNLEDLEDYVSPAHWRAMSKEEQDKIHQKHCQNHFNQRTNQSQTTPSVSATTQVSSQYNCNQTVATTTSEVTTPTVHPSTANPTPSQTQAQRFLVQADQTPSSLVFSGRTYVLLVTNISYQLNKHKIDNSVRYSLIDWGANGGLSGDDVRVLEMNTSPTKQVDVTGIAGAKVSNVPLKTVAGVIQTT